MRADGVGLDSGELARGLAPAERARYHSRTPEQALEVARNMARDRRILTLEGGRMTTLAVRAQEQAIERRTISLVQPADRDVGETIRINASRQVAERIGAPLSAEQ